jgi:hypothetical protein
MPTYNKPSNLNVVWADSGNKIKPEDSKILTGWVGGEIPPAQFFNYLENRQDRAIAHITQYGISEWDAISDYIGGKSIVQGSNGTVYRAKVDNFGKDPTIEQDYWEEAFSSVNSLTTRAAFVGYITQSTSFSAEVNNNYYISAPLIVTLPATANNGDVVNLIKKPNVNPSVKVSGGASITTSTGSDTVIIYDIDDSVTFVFNGTNWEV